MTEEALIEVFVNLGIWVDSLNGRTFLFETSKFPEHTLELLKEHGYITKYEWIGHGELPWAISLTKEQYQYQKSLRAVLKNG